MNNPRVLLGLVLVLAGPLSASAQTSFWIGQGNLATQADWNDPSNWDTGVVPNGPASTVDINHASLAYRNYPDGPYVYYSDVFSPPVVSVAGGALPVLTGPVTLGRLSFGLPGGGNHYQAALYIGTPGGGPAGALTLTGAGADLNQNGGAINADINVTPGSSLTLVNRAAFSSTPYGYLSVFLSVSNGAANNPARLQVQDDASLGTGPISGPGPIRQVYVSSIGPASVVLMDRAHAGNAYISLGKNSSIAFHNTASADTSVLAIGSGSLLLFDGDTTATGSMLAFNNTSLLPVESFIRFAGRSSAAQSTVTSLGYGTNNGAVEFTEQATGGTASISARRLDISGAASLGGTTGRQRASSSTLASSSIVATDARTIKVSEVQVQDLLLGSNTLEVTSGFITNIRDSGGAYRSSAGENLVGGGLIKVGTGALLLNGPTYNPADPDHASYNVITGPTIVRGGTLVLSNRLADVTVESAGRLDGSGIVGGRLVNQGTLEQSFGTGLQVNGDYVQTASAKFVPFVAASVPGTTTSALNVGGLATLAGTISVSPHPNLFDQFKPGVVTIDVLTAGSLAGLFDKLDTSNNSARIHASVLYSSTKVSMRFEMVPLASMASTAAGQAMGAYLDRAYVYTGSYFPNNYNYVVDSLTFANDSGAVAKVLNNLGPDSYGVLPAHGFNAAVNREAFLDRVAGGPVDRPERGPISLFAEGGRRNLTYLAGKSLPEATGSTNLRLAGGRWCDGAWTFGMFVAGEKTDLRLDPAGSLARIDSVEPGGFVRYETGPYYVTASGRTSRDRYELLRFVDSSPFNSMIISHRASPQGKRTDWSVTAGRVWTQPHWALTPLVGFVTSQWSLADFTEMTDRTFSHDELTIKQWAHNSRRARAGVLVTGSGMAGRISPRLAATWWHEFSADRSIPAGFVGAASTYLAPGRPADREIFQVTGGIDVRLSRHAHVNLDAAFQHGDRSRSTSDFTAGFRWDF